MSTSRSPISPRQSNSLPLACPRQVRGIELGPHFRKSASASGKTAGQDCPCASPVTAAIPRSTATAPRHGPETRSGRARAALLRGVADRLTQQQCDAEDDAVSGHRRPRLDLTDVAWCGRKGRRVAGDTVEDQGAVAAVAPRQVDDRRRDLRRERLGDNRPDGLQERLRIGRQRRYRFEGIDERDAHLRRDGDSPDTRSLACLGCERSPRGCHQVGSLGRCVPPPRDVPVVTISRSVSFGRRPRAGKRRRDRLGDIGA